jgi:DNA-binding response OmpR family regulator
MRILVLEDEMLIALHLHEELLASGHEVLGPAGTIEEAQQLLDSHDAIDFAILDANIDGAAPIGLVRKIAARAIPFAYLSGYDEAYIRDNLPKGPILAKPLDMAALTRLLTELKPAEA